MDNIREYIFENSSMRSVIEGYGIHVDKTGKFLCPFHNDKHPSAGILKNDKSFNCFSCGEKGNIYNFIDKYEEKVNGRKLSSNEIYKKMAELSRINIDLSQLDYEKKENQRRNMSSYDNHQQNLLETLGFANRAYQYYLNTKIGEDAKNYLINERGLSQKIIEEFSIGYAPEGYLDRLIREADQHTIEEMQEMIKRNPLYNYQNLFDTGLLKMTESQKIREVFHNRITIPIADKRGNIVGFGARTLDKSNKIKYLNTAETELFHKSDILFNYHNAVHDIKSQNEIIIVEGYMDVIGARQLEFKNCVGLMGTAFSDSNLKTVLDLNCNITLALDNDEAGHKAIISAIQKIHEIDQNKTINVIDIGKIGHYKDFGDLGQAKVQKRDIENAKISSFEFLMENLYCKDRQLNNENVILEIYNQCVEDKFITNSRNKTIFKNYISNLSKFSNEEIEDIINSKDLATPYQKYAENVMRRDVEQNIQDFLKSYNDKVLTDYYNLNKGKIFEEIFGNLKKSTQRYYDTGFTKLNVAICLNDILKDNKEWEEYQKINRFQFEQAFTKCYTTQEVNGEMVIQQIALNDDQKRIIVQQYENTVDNNLKLNLNHVEEIYVINSIKDLENILPQAPLLSNDIKDVYIKQLREHHKMQFFKYATIFPKEFLSSIDGRYKTEDGLNYKTIMLVDNLNHDIKISEENLIKVEEATKDKEMAIEENEIALELDEIVKQSNGKLVPPQNPKNSNRYYFTINMELLKREDREDKYVVRIPNTQGRYYMDIEKSNSRWVNDDQKILLSFINKDKTYNAYEKVGKDLVPTQLEGMEIIKYWEDKTKENAKESKKDTISIPTYKIHTITKQGCYIQSTQKDMFYFIPNKYVKYDENHKNLFIEPTLVTRFSLYKNENGEMKIQNRQIKFKDLKKEFGIISPNKASRNEVSIKLNIHDLRKNNDFIVIPLHDKESGRNGYVQVNAKFICKDENNQMFLKGFKNYNYALHLGNSLVGQEMKRINIQQLNSMYKDYIENKKELEFEREGV